MVKRILPLVVLFVVVAVVPAVAAHGPAVVEGYTGPTQLDTQAREPTTLLLSSTDGDFAGTWTRMTAGAEWSERGRHTNVVLSDGSIVLMGGYGANTYYNDVWRSTNQGATWIQMTANAGWAPRDSHTSVALSDDSIVLMGGYDSNTRYNDVWRSTDQGATWTRMTANAGWSGRELPASVALSDDSIILMGGDDGGSFFTSPRKNDVWRSTDKGATWKRLTANAGWKERYGNNNVVALSDDTIILMGGVGPDWHNDVWKSTDQGAKWTRVTADAGWAKRAGHDAVALSDDSIILMGGNDANIRYNDIWQSTDRGATWSRITASAAWPARTVFASAALPDDSIALMGGNSSDGHLNDVWRMETRTQSSLRIEDVSPNGITNTGKSNIRIIGKSFDEGISVWFQHSKYPQYKIRAERRFDSSTRIYVMVDWTDAIEGYWDLILENPDSQKCVKEAAICVLSAIDKPLKEDPSITLTGSQKLWIDPLSEGDRQVTIRYLVTPADYSGKVIMEVFDATGKRVGEVTKTVTSGGTGSLTWDGRINSRPVNPAKNPYTVRFRLEDSGGSDLTGAVSRSQQVFVGRPVIFVHGINALAKDIDTNPGFQAFSENYYTVAVEYADSKFETFLGNIPQFSRRLDQEIRQIKQDTGAKKVDIAAHSMGGLVSRYYIEKMGGRDDVGKLIMIQTPNHGSEWIDLRALLEYTGADCVMDIIKYERKLLSKFEITVQASDASDGFLHTILSLIMELPEQYHKNLEKYDTIAPGQMAPYNKFLADLNGNELPYASDYYMKKGLVQDRIQDPSGYVVIASQNFLTPSHFFITAKIPFIEKTINERYPGVTKGDLFVSYNSAKLTVAPIVKIEGFHVNPWEKESVMNHLAEFLSSTDDYPQLTVKACSDDWLTSLELQEEVDDSHESGFWSDWITTNVSKSEDLNLTFMIEPLTTSARFFFLWDEGTLSLSFTAPNGTVTDTITSEIQCEYSIDAAPGIWNVTIHPVSIPDDTVEVSAASYQTNPMIFELLPEVEETKPGDTLPVAVYYGTDSEPCTEATVTATVMKPDKSVSSLTLYDTTGDGIYSSTFTDTTMPGAYLISASGSWTIDDVTLSRSTRKYIVLMEYPDLAIDEIVVTPQDPRAGEEIDIATTISNCGSADATNVAVTVYADINSFRYSIGNRTFDIPMGDSATFTTRWRARTGLHTIIALVDSCDEVIEESYSNNIGNATVNVQSSMMGLESANITICEDETGLIPIILTNCTGLQYIAGTFAFNNSVVEFVNASSTASSIECENTTGLVRFNITYDEETAGDTSVADIVMRGVGAPGEGTETKIVIDAFDGLGLHGATLTGSNQIALIRNVTDDLELHANFTANPTAGNSPLTIHFTDESAGNVTAWSWSFGDGNVSTDQNPTHTYTALGNYTVNLTVSSEAGSDTLSRPDYITVTRVKGDFNGNGEVDIGDVSKVAYMVVGKEPADPTADFNGNDRIDIGDAAKIAYYFVGKIGEL